MRTWGRQYAEDGTYTWVEVSTDANGNNDAVWLTTLAQCLQLNLGESPMFGNYGIPSQQSAVTQVAPDYYVVQTQQQFAQYFASLIVTREPGLTPDYTITGVSHTGAILPNNVPV